MSALDDDDVITDFTEANATTILSNVKVKLAGQTGNNGTQKIEIMVPLKYLIIAATNVAKQGTTFSITNTKLYVILSIKDKSKLLEQSKSDFEKTINWNKYQLKVLTERPNQYLDFLVDPSFQGVRLFVLSFEN